MSAYPDATEVSFDGKPAASAVTPLCANSDCGQPRGHLVVCD